MILDDVRIEELVVKISSFYDIGNHSSFKKMDNGYDDLNIQITVGEEKYLAKIFSFDKSDAQCQLYIQAIRKSLDTGVNHPQLHKGNLQTFAEINLSDSADKVRVCLMDFVEGDNLYKSGVTLEDADYDSLVYQISLLHKVDLKGTISQGPWSITNFEQIFNNKKHVLSEGEIKTIADILLQFSKIKIDLLPRKFIHGDLVKTNIIKNTSDLPFIIDFSAAGYYPRIQELAVLLTNVFFDENSIDNSMYMYQLLLSKYQRHAKLTDYELEALPLFVMAAHCINIICPVYENVVNNNSTYENEYWMNLGRKGLEMKAELYLG